MGQGHGRASEAPQVAARPAAVPGRLPNGRWPTVETSSQPKWATVQAAGGAPNWKFDFSTPPAEIDGVLNWSHAIGVTKSEAGQGSQGVLFVALPEGAVVLKGCMQLAAEVFATSVARQLGIPGPRMRVIAMGSTEGQAVRKRLKSLNGHIRSVLNARNMIVMEFLHGKTLSSIKPRDFERFASDGLQVILRQLGALAALDILLNNTDRVPLLANNRGNAGNLMFSSTNGHIISLDNGIMSLKGAGLERYASKAYKLLREIFRSPSIPVEGTRKVANTIREHTHHDIGTEGMVWLQEGIIQFVVECCSSLDVGKLMTIKETLAGIDPDMVGLSDIKEEYLEVMMLLFHQVQCDSGEFDFRKMLAQARDTIANRSLLDEHKSTGEDASPKAQRSKHDMPTNEESKSGRKETSKSHSRTRKTPGAPTKTSTNPSKSPIARPSKSPTTNPNSVSKAHLGIPSTVDRDDDMPPLGTTELNRERSIGAVNMSLQTRANPNVYAHCSTTLGLVDTCSLARGLAEELTQAHPRELLLPAGPDPAGPAAVAALVAEHPGKLLALLYTDQIAFASKNILEACSWLAVVVHENKIALLREATQRVINHLRGMMALTTLEVQTKGDYFGPRFPSVEAGGRRVAMAVASMLSTLQTQAAHEQRRKSNPTLPALHLQQPSGVEPLSLSARLVESRMVAIRGANTFVRLACDGRVLHAECIHVVTACGELSQTAVLRLLCEVRAIVDGVGNGGKKLRARHMRSLQTGAQSLFSTTQNVIAVLAFLTPLLGHLSHRNQALLSLAQAEKNLTRLKLLLTKEGGLAKILTSATAVKCGMTTRINGALEALQVAFVMLRTSFSCVETEKNKDQGGKKSSIRRQRCRAVTAALAVHHAGVQKLLSLLPWEHAQVLNKCNAQALASICTLCAALRDSVQSPSVRGMEKRLSQTLAAACSDAQDLATENQRIVPVSHHKITVDQVADCLESLSVHAETVRRMRAAYK